MACGGGGVEMVLVGYGSNVGLGLNEGSMVWVSGCYNRDLVFVIIYF